jgi:hypothetical protein
MPVRNQLAVICVFAASAGAAIRHIEIRERMPVAQGYERLTGSVTFGVNPKLAANRIIRDIQYAPVNGTGEVEFSADLYILRPQDPAKSNGTVLFEVSNRGGRGMPGRFEFARGGDDVGDGRLLAKGYTLVWVGWEWDVPKSQAGLLHLRAPHFRPDALPAQGLVRSEFIPMRSATSMNLGDRAQEPIAVDKAVGLYVRESVEAAPREIAHEKWTLSADQRSLEMPGGFEPGMLYEFVYQGKDPVVAGTGLAAVRDIVSFLKYGGADSPLGDHRQLQRAIGFGISQSGRFLRQFLYDGFNADENNRKVFDAVWADVAGAGRGAFNYRYAQPSRDGHPYLNILYPTDVFPFVDSELLAAARSSRTAPKLFLTNNSYEYWGRVASLVHLTPDGKSDAVLLPDTRVYFVAGVQHGPGSLPLHKDGTRYDLGPIDHRPVQRALLEALQAWIKDGAAPPDSVYPKLAAGELTSPKALQFPVPGVTVPEHPRIARKEDLGPQFENQGIVLREPPQILGAYPLLVPQVDADGIDRGGIRLPEVAVPLATITGWNLRSPERGASQQMAEFDGSTFPFTRTKQERERSGDRRLSIAERYTGREDYLKKAAAAVDELIRRRLVLPEDRETVLAHATNFWAALAQ